MEKSERAKLLRARLRAVRGYDLPPIVPAKRRPKPEPKGVYHADPYGCPQHPAELPIKWVFAPEDKPERPAFETRRIARKSALQRIADRWDERKLLPKPPQKSKLLP